MSEILRILLLVVLLIVVVPLLVSAEAVPSISAVLPVAASSAPLLVLIARLVEILEIVRLSPLLVKGLEIVRRSRFGHWFGVCHNRGRLVKRHVPPGLLLHRWWGLLHRHWLVCGNLLHRHWLICWG